MYDSKLELKMHQPVRMLHEKSCQQQRNLTAPSAHYSMACGEERPDKSAIVLWILFSITANITN